ncbi:MAG: YtxH domain-containing protein [Candidatus Aegiribacteria sp.]
MAGAFAGSIAALLYAPARGEETREKVRTTSGEIYEKGEEYYRAFRAEAEKLIDEGRKMIDGAGSASREKIEDTIKKLEEARDKIDRATEKGKEKVEELKEKVEKKGGKSSAGSEKKKK